MRTLLRPVLIAYVSQMSIAVATIVTVLAQAARVLAHLTSWMDRADRPETPRGIGALLVVSAL